MHMLNTPLIIFLTQCRGRDPKESHQARKKKHDFSTSARKGRQGENRSLEVRPHQNPAYIQRSFRFFCMTVADLVPQTELAINTHAIVFRLEHNEQYVANMVSDIHRTVLKGQEGNDGGRPLVRDNHTQSITNNSLIIAQPQSRSAVSNTNDNTTSCLYPAHMESRLLRHLGLVSDVTK